MSSSTPYDPKNMQFRHLGPAGMKVSAFSLGGWLTYGASDFGLQLTKDCLKTAWEAGVNTFDTAEAYAAGESEAVMGQAIKELGWRREDYVLITKIYFGTNGPPPNGRGLSRKHVWDAYHASLKRLQVDYCDVVFCHRPDPETPMEEVVRIFTDFIKQGKALYWGTSEWSAFEIEHAYHAATKYNLIAPIVEQPQYHMLHRERFEKEYHPLYKLYNYGTTIWSPLARGILTGKYNNGVPEGSRFTTSFPSGLKMLEGESGKEVIQKVVKCEEVAKKIGCTVGQLALAWTLKNPNVSTCILGASKPEQVKENVKALDYVDKITPEMMQQLDEILDNKPEIPGRM